MDYTQTAERMNPTASTSTSIELDPQDVVFDKLVDSWVEGEISYNNLMEYYPTYDSSMAKKILTAIRKLFI